MDGARHCRADHGSLLLERDVKFYLFMWIVVIVGLFGWVANIVKLVGMIDGGVTAMFIARIVGVFAAPAGAVLGFV
jgi:hypothetical protein